MKYFLFVSLILLGLTMKAQVGIGTTLPMSSLDINGSLSTDTRVISTSTAVNLDDTYHTILAGGGGTLNLPQANLADGREYFFIGGSAGITVAAASGETIDNSFPSINLLFEETLLIQSFGSFNTWLIVKDGRNKSIGIDDLTDGKTLNNSLYVGENSGLGANGTNNVGMGTGTLINVVGTENIGIGYIAGATINSGSNNIVIGTLASAIGGTGITTGNNNILIGDRVNASGQAVSNELNIGDAIYATGLYGTTAQVGIGNTNNAPNSTLSVSGSMSLPIRSGGATTLTDNDYTYLTTGGNVRLPAAAGNLGRIYVIKNISGSNINLQTTGSDRIDGINNATIPTLRTRIVQSDGVSEWYIIGDF